MLARLDWMTIKPAVILDAGCGTGEMSAELQVRYPDALILSLDSDHAMTDYVKAAYPNAHSLCADAIALPLKDNSVDLVFANLLLPWCHNAQALLREWRRVLRSDGVLMLSALGPDSLQEYLGLLHPAIPLRVDMHDIGDLLLAEGFTDPVLDVDYYTITYRDLSQCLNELKASGMWFPASSGSLPDPKAFLPTENGLWPITYEAIFAHAFVPDKKPEKSDNYNNEIKIPLSQITGLKNSKN